jgi:hypothetical protein
MKTMAALIGALLMTLALTAPAVAVKSVTATVATAFCEPDPGPDLRDWVAGKTYHVRDWGFTFQMFLLDNGVWIDNGTRIHYDEADNVVPNKEGYTAHGKMTVLDSVFGDFDGSWSSTPNNVNVTLKGLEGALYGHLKISIIGASGEITGLPALPDQACGGTYDPNWYEISIWTLH